MPLYMDIHRNVEDLSKEAVRLAHAADLKVQEKHGAEFIKYWFNEEAGFVSCLFSAPSKEAGRAVHEEAHGLVTDEIYEVQEGE